MGCLSASLANRLWRNPIVSELPELYRGEREQLGNVQILGRRDIEVSGGIGHAPNGTGGRTARKEHAEWASRVRSDYHLP